MAPDGRQFHGVLSCKECGQPGQRFELGFCEFPYFVIAHYDDQRMSSWVVGSIRVPGIAQRSCLVNFALKIDDKMVRDVHPALFFAAPVLLLGSQIKLARKSRRMSERDLASRAGIARSTLQKIEQGDPTINIGLAFEAAILAGVPLFVADASTLAPKIARLHEILALMPKQIRRKRWELKDDF